MAKTLHQKRFQEQLTFEERFQESSKILSKYPDRVPVIVERHRDCKTLGEIDKRKYLVPRDLTVSQFVVVLRKRMKLPQTSALFIFVENNIAPGSELVSNLYNKYKQEDGFVYFNYLGENTFG